LNIALSEIMARNLIVYQKL